MTATLNPSPPSEPREDGPVPFEELLRRFEEAQEAERQALEAQHRTERRALCDRQLQKKLEFHRDNPEGVMELVLADVERQSRRDF